MPSADQSRCASSISLSDLLIHTALRRPCSQLSRMIRRTGGLCRAGAVAEHEAAPEAHGVLGILARR
jgi:hypothetical protein